MFCALTSHVTLAPQLKSPAKISQTSLHAALPQRKGPGAKGGGGGGRGAGGGEGGGEGSGGVGGGEGGVSGDSIPGIGHQSGRLFLEGP